MRLAHTSAAVGDSCPNADLDRRFGALARLYGGDGARRIAGSHAVVVGVGGVGSWAAEALVRSGLGRITLIDLDHVAESNINRQLQALDATLGMAKVGALQQRFGQINPECAVHAVEEFVDPDNVGDLIPAEADVVLDCCDQVLAKTAIAALCLHRLQPLLMAGAAGGKRHADRVECADLALVTHDPLLAKVRHRLRREHAAPREGRIGLACAFSAEPVRRHAVPADAAAGAQPGSGGLSCNGYGSSVMVTATMGMVLASRAADALITRR